MQEPANDNRQRPLPRPVAGLVPIVGFIAGDGLVTITDKTWTPAPIRGPDDIYSDDTRGGGQHGGSLGPT